MARNLVAEMRAQEQQAAAPKPARNLLKDVSMFPSVKPVGPVSEDEEQKLSFSSRATAQFADDPSTQMKVYAQEIQEKYFPDSTPEEVFQNQMRVVDDQIVYTLGEPADQSGATYKYYYAEPQSMGGQIAQTLPAAGPGMVLAGVLAPAGTALGAASPVPGGSVAGGMAGAALGEAGGEGYRKAVGNLLLDEPQTVEGNLEDLGEAAAWSAGGEAFFKGLGRLFRKAEVRDIEDFDMASAEAIEGLAKEYGITLTPAQSSGLQSLMSRQKVLMNSPEGQDIMRKFFDVQNEQIQKSVYDLFSTMSKVESPREGFQKGAQAIQKRLDQLVRRRSKIAERDYGKAFADQKEPIDVSGLVEKLQSRLPDANSGQQRAINSILKEIRDPVSGELKTNLQSLHNAKVQIDDYIKNAKRGSGSAANMNLAELEGARQSLLGILDAQSPAYKTARKKFEIASKPINRLESSVAGDLMGFGSDQAYKVGRTLFNDATGPAEVRRTMKLIRNMDPEAADAVVRGYLQQVFEKSLKETQQGTIEQVGGKARKAMFGTILDRRMLRAAMEPGQFKAFSDLMDVLKATTRGTSKGSDTAFNQAEREAMKQESKGMLTKAAEGLTLSRQRIMDGLEQIRLGEYTEEMAQLFTSGSSLREYTQAANVLKKASPNSKKFWDSLGAVVGSITGQQFTDD